MKAQDEQLGISMRFVQGWKIGPDMVESKHEHVYAPVNYGLSECRCGHMLYDVEETGAFAVTQGRLIEQIREEGRREVLREIAALSPRAEADGWIVCHFCEVSLEGQVHPHKPDCLWLRAQAVKASE